MPTTREKALEAALRAIRARVVGEYDQPELVAFGPLSTDSAHDCSAIASLALALPSTPDTPTTEPVAAGEHTPGPWHRNIKPATKYPTVWSGRNLHVAYVSTGGGL